MNNYGIARDQSVSDKLSTAKTILRQSMVSTHNLYQRILSSLQEVDMMIQAKGTDTEKAQSAELVQACKDYLKSLDPIIYKFS